MKKYLVLLIPFLITGCMNASGVLTETCTKEIVTKDMKETDKYEFEYFEGKITKMVVTKTYEPKVDLEGNMKAWNTFKGVKASVSDNTITYEFELNEISEDIKEEFNIKETYNEQVKNLKSLDFNCKG